MIDRSKKLPAFFYQTPGGDEPVRDWIKGLSPEDRQIAGRDVRKVEFLVGLSACHIAAV